MKLRQVVDTGVGVFVATVIGLGVFGGAAAAATPAPKPAAPAQPAARPCNLERFVAQAYEDLLQRPVDPVNLQSWVSQLKLGGSRAQVALMIMNSPEYRARQAQSLYSALLGRAADPAGLNTYAGMLQRGGSTEGVEAAILSSPEYFQVRGGGSNDGFLKALYRDALGRSLDPAGTSQFGQMLEGGGSRATVAAAVVGSAEARQHRTKMLYGEFLGRLPGSRGQAAGTGPGDDQSIAAIIGSDEYCARL